MTTAGRRRRPGAHGRDRRLDERRPGPAAVRRRGRGAGPAGAIVEIGSFRGRSTSCWRRRRAADVEVVAIDPHAGNDRGPQEIDGFADEAATDRAASSRPTSPPPGSADRVRHVASFSDAAHAAVDDPIDVLYIDGAHRYGPARADIRDWGRRVADGGTMLIHDSFSSIGVTLAIGRELVPGRRFRYVGRSPVARPSTAPTCARRRVGRNAARQLAQLPWFARNVGLKVLLTLGLGRVMERLGRPVPEWPY